MLGIFVSTFGATGIGRPELALQAQPITAISKTDCLNTWFGACDSLEGYTIVLEQGTGERSLCQLKVL